MSIPSSILLVDDEPDIVQTLGYRLQAAGYDVTTAVNGEEALEVLRRQDVDLILADFMMPEMNGIELTRAIKAHPKWFGTKILLFSANSDPEFRRRALELGAVDYLPKTMGANQILEKVYDEVRPRQGFDDPPTPARQPANSQESAAVVEHAVFKGQLKALARSLSDVLQIAQRAGEVGDATAFALESAQRLAGEILELSETGAATSKEH